MCVIGPRLERDGYIGLRRGSLLLSDLVGLEQRYIYLYIYIYIYIYIPWFVDIWFLAPMSETFLSAGGGRLTWLTSLRTHLVAIDPVGRGELW